ncbi:MAG: DUF86 domain-containing protein [Actinomycetota bacterium]|nr:DUF86 domain-containing protein [Actinomycetota bacterium]
MIEIGEAVNGLPTELIFTEPDIPWQEVAWMRDHLAHHYFDITHSRVRKHRRSRTDRASGGRRPDAQACPPGVMRWTCR